MYCPRCSSSKYTSLPFGNVTSSKDSAITYRCLACDLLFLEPVEGEALGWEYPVGASGDVSSPSAQSLSLTYNLGADTWDLTDEHTGRLIKSFMTKEAATRKGVLKTGLGEEIGSVVIRQKVRVYKEERRYGGSM